MSDAREADVASEMVDLLVANVTAADVIPLDVLAHLFGIACENLNFVPDEVSACRILHSVRGEIALRQRAADKLNNFVLTRTEDLLQARRDAE